MNVNALEAPQRDLHKHKIKQERDSHSESSSAPTHFRKSLWKPEEQTKLWATQDRRDTFFAGQGRFGKNPKQIGRKGHHKFKRKQKRAEGEREVFQL